MSENVKLQEFTQDILNPLFSCKTLRRSRLEEIGKVISQKNGVGEQRNYLYRPFQNKSKTIENMKNCGKSKPSERCHKTRDASIQKV